VKRRKDAAHRGTDDPKVGLHAEPPVFPVPVSERLCSEKFHIAGRLLALGTYTRRKPDLRQQVRAELRQYG